MHKLPFQRSDIVIEGAAELPPREVARLTRRKLRELNGLVGPPARKNPRHKIRHHPVWKEMESAAARFTALDPLLQAKNDLRHISRTASGYQIRIDRFHKRVFDQSVYGHSQRSLLKAMRLRDEALHQWPSSRRTNLIPAAVLEALGLTEAVVGINRFPPRSRYRVNYFDRSGRKRVRTFSFRVVPEEVAYAAAIDFLQRGLQKWAPGGAAP